MSIGMLAQPAKRLVFVIVALVGILQRPTAAALTLIAVLLAAAPAAQASQPIEVLRKSIDDGLRILNDPCSQPADCKALQQEQLRQVLYRDFDFAEFSKRVLAQKWALFTEAQRREFVDLFSRFLSEHYLARLQQHYTNEKVLLRGQTMVAPGRAVVKSAVVWKNREFTLDVAMHSHGGAWKIYDVTVIGFSAVQIYRAQFQHLLRTQSPAQIIDLIKNRIAEERL